MGETKTFLGSIVSAKYSRLIGVSALAVLFAISALVLVPVCKSQDDTFAAPTPSTTTLAMTTPSVSLSLALDDAAGTFAVSDPASFSVTTNNYTGYALSIRAKEDNANNSKLINGSHVLSSISAATADGTGFSVGDWGYKPSKLNSADNTDFLPAPTYAGSVLNATTTANTTADNYSLALAAKANYSTAVGTYSNTFVLIAVPNPVNYTITYDKNTTDNVTNMPAAQVGTLSDQDIIISSAVPSRTGYDFDGWCDGDVTTTSGIQSCSGTEYNPGVVYTASMQTANTLSLKAIWNVPGTARAILGSNGNLNFVYDNNTYTVGNTYTDNLGSTTISAVYDVPINSTSTTSKPAWVGSSSNYRTDITSANFAQSFSRFKPTSTAYWFEQDRHISSITNASNLNTSNVIDMTSMFNGAGYNATTFSLDLSSWNVSKVIKMSRMFYNAGYRATTWSIGDLSSWNVSNVTNMSYMFTNAGNYTTTTWDIGNLSSWIVSNVTDMTSMFNGAGNKATTTWSIGDLSSWNVSKVINMSSMFNMAGQYATTWSIGDLSSWNVSKVTNMSGMFGYAGYRATTWNIGNLSSWNVSNVTNMSYMFRQAGYKATTWSIGDLSSWNVSNVTNMGSMFDNAGFTATTWNIGNLSSWIVSNVTNMSRMFYNAGYSATYTLDLRSWNASKVTNHTNFNNGVTSKVLAPTFPS